MHNRFYSKNERKVLEFYKKEMDTEYRTQPYDLNKKEDLKAFLDMLLVSYMDFRKYWGMTTDLVEEMDETLELYDPVTWVSLVDDELSGDQRMVETIDALALAQEHMSEIFANVDNKLRHLLEVLLNKEDAVQIFVWNKAYAYSDSGLEEVMDDLLDHTSAQGLEDMYHALTSAFDKHLSAQMTRAITDQD